MKWKTELTSQGIGGITVDDGMVILGSRDFADQQDLFEAFRCSDGKLVWQYRYDAPGKLDYGNSPRATPLIYESLIFVLGAFGDLVCLDQLTGVPIWQKNLLAEFNAIRPEWGFSSSPIIVEDQLIVQTSSPDAAVVALDPISGELIWKSAGGPGAYASPVQQENQVICLDQLGIHSYDAKSGSKGWSIHPPVRGDFGVPTPLPTQFGLVVTSENNGTRIYETSSKETNLTPRSHFPKAAPNSHSPICIDERVYIVDNKLYCLSTRRELDKVWVLEDRSLRQYTSLIATDTHLLAVTGGGELLLVEASSGNLIGRQKIEGDNHRILAHPALVDRVLYVRTGNVLMAIDLE